MTETMFFKFFNILNILIFFSIISVILNIHITSCLGKTSDGVKTILEDTFPLWKNRPLPVGDLDDGSILRCNVTVTDDMGSSGTYPIEDVKVY